MSTLELPKASKSVAIGAAVVCAAAVVAVCIHHGRHPLLAIMAFFVSGFLADLFTGLAHFGFDYVFPERMPILGPIAREFREHHDCPTLDPSNYVENFTKGGYCSLPLSIAVLVLAGVLPEGAPSFAVIAIVMGMSLWALFFHQIHSYAHMGACLSPDEFKQRVKEISRLPTERQQIEEFDRLFSNVPIPPLVRFLQRWRLILNPKTHNLHHISFESDFSSVNGWSDPVINVVLRPFARRFKLAAQVAKAEPG